jgi:hypothetical protein
MRANPTRAAGGVGCEKTTPCRKNYTAVLVSRFEAALQFCFGCCPKDTTFRWQRNYSCMIDLGGAAWLIICLSSVLPQQ